MDRQGEGEVMEMPTGTRGNTEEYFQIQIVSMRRLYLWDNWHAFGPGGLPAADDEDPDEDEQQNHTADHRHQQHGGVSTISDDGRGNWKEKNNIKVHLNA